jgi:glutamate-1-semialdehyde aminotransferase
MDVSAPQQDISKDFVIGARAAVADLNARRLAGRFTLMHEVIEVSGSGAQATRTALRSAKAELHRSGRRYAPAKLFEKMSK